MVQIVLITGATSGIGEACAHQFAQAGWQLILTGRRQDRLDIIKEQLEKAYKVKVLTCCFDIRNRQQTIQQLSSLPQAWSKVTTLVNNAGLAAGLESFESSDLDDFEQMIDTNIKGLLYATHAILPGMLARKQGDIINIGSISSHQVYPKGHVYCGTKHAVHAITQGLRHDTVGKGIRVCSVDPGAVETEFSLVRFKDDHEKAQQVYEGMTPLNAHDVADAVFYCATRPKHVCIADIIVLPADQASVSHIARHSAI